jgi:hypothetical protein
MVIETLAAWAQVMDFTLNVADHLAKSKTVKEVVRNLSQSIKGLSVDTTIPVAERLVEDRIRIELDSSEADSLITDMDLLRRVLHLPMHQVSFDDPWGRIRYGDFLTSVGIHIRWQLKEWQVETRWGHEHQAEYYIRLPHTTRNLRNTEMLRGVFAKGYLRQAEIFTSTLGFRLSTFKPIQVLYPRPPGFDNLTVTQEKKLRSVLSRETVVISGISPNEDRLWVYPNLPLARYDVARRVLSSKFAGEYPRHADIWDSQGKILPRDRRLADKSFKIPIEHEFFRTFLYGLCADLIYYSALVRRETTLGRQALSGLLGKVKLLK